MSAQPSVRFHLSRQQRIKPQRDFRQVRRQGQRVIKGCLIANWLKLPAGSISRVGVVTTRRIGGAPIRSRARRLLREAFRLRQHDLQGPVALVLVARNSIVGKTFSAVQRDLIEALKQARVLKENI